MIDADAEHTSSNTERALQLGPFAIRANAAEVESFRREVGGKEGGVPFTFPVRWLTRPEIHAAAAQIVEGNNWVPIHESQSFDYRKALAIDVDYRMSVTMSREEKPARIILHAEISTQDETRLRMEMILRIVTMPGEGEGQPG